MTTLQKELIQVNQYKLGGNTSQLPTAPKENTQTMKQLKFDNLYQKVYILKRAELAGKWQYNATWWTNVVIPYGHSTSENHSIYELITNVNVMGH